jgi:hypothetical protein
MEHVFWHCLATGALNDDEHVANRNRVHRHDARTGALTEGVSQEPMKGAA